MDFILDVDGVLTDGSFLYSKEGKIYKKFGPHDAYSLKKLSKLINISFISADSRGFEITKKRIDDMGFEVKLVSEEERYEYIVKNYNLESLIYMGDGTGAFDGGGVVRDFPSNIGNFFAIPQPLCARFPY